ncbi:hypothetical protein, conserved [Babesia bigemina]|uniref:Uncharacterized protein n=1 Tax=Babesia bigemina TaxID=5866 RepID=A0A061D6L1_BABBI|nr:hypothetical protein, conserved [Babesia bigemina]CDR94584.1 hypothetical protein, conserved [Babesia bigemina]|eukprot:XP_012766770.1 hypothetical protein, conserved [Babesia bigemina]
MRHLIRIPGSKKVRNHFINAIPEEIATHPGISAAVVDIAEYNRLARMRGFREINSNSEMAYLIYTHRDIYKSLKFHPERHRARWDTVRFAVDRVLQKRMFRIGLGDGSPGSTHYTCEFDYSLTPLHDLTTNVYDEVGKLSLYLDLRKKYADTSKQYDVLSLANATPDFVVLGYRRCINYEEDLTVLVHRTRGSWVQIASLLTIKITKRDIGIQFTLDKDTSVYKSCHACLSSKAESVGFLHDEWRDCCVAPEMLDTHARLTFEDYLWEHHNVYANGMHPYQQSVLLLACGAVHHSSYSMEHKAGSPPDTNEGLDTYLGNDVVGPYLSLMKRMIVPRSMSESALPEALRGKEVTRVDYLLGLWLAYVSSVQKLRKELSAVRFEDYAECMTTDALVTYQQKAMVMSLTIIAVISLVSALISGYRFKSKQRQARLEIAKQEHVLHPETPRFYGATDVDTDSVPENNNLRRTPTWTEVPGN